MNGFLVAAPHSGSGKTTVTLGLLRALRNRGVKLAPAKAGPDYIDPAFHEAASGEPCINLDPWAMRPDLLHALANSHAGDDRLLIVEGMMGLFDGAADGEGSAADLAVLLGLPIVFVVDCGRMAHSIAALVSGFMDFREDVEIAGVILNRVGSARHESMLREALDARGIAVLGVVHRQEELHLPSRHLGLVQAGEHQDIERFFADAALAVTVGVDLDRLAALTVRGRGSNRTASRLPPLGQRISVARDEAFAFSYPHLLHGWRDQGAEISFFSPLADEIPSGDPDAVYLPGGYPELHAERIAAAGRFLGGLRAAAEAGIRVYGECGGYMVLGDELIDGGGERHGMAGLLPVTTSYAKRQRHLGYRRLTPLAGAPWDLPLTAHEFHYSTLISEGEGERLFSASDARGEALGEVGLRRGSVSGSYMHVIDRAA
ncbi:MAG: cobyrinic acid a,c-diamide synthase [Ahrensia sp.]|nr:cobyrinic acid a,c-diamide synthase [Ahrensia sp.]